jgi:hypothetical protein
MPADDRVISQEAGTTMKQFETVIAAGLVGAIAIQELQHQGLEPIQHANESGVDRPIGRDAIEVRVTTGAIPFINPMDDISFRRYRQDSSAYYSSQANSETPLTLRALSIIR